MANKKISATLHAQLTEKLESLLDQQDDVASNKKTIVDAIKGQQKRIALGVSQTRRRLKGQDLDQTEIPGTEIAELGVDPVVEDILRAAGALKAAKDQEEASALKWVQADDDHTAEPTDGIVYSVSPGQRATFAWDARRSADYGETWTPVGTGFVTVTGAKKACERDFLERGADAILKNAGSGELTKADTKGEAVARKKGGRRG